MHFSYMFDCNLWGFGMIDDANGTYYALDYLFDGTNSNFVLYNRNWTYLTYKNMPIDVPTSITSIKNELFVAAKGGIYKLDKSLNIVKSYLTESFYIGIYHQLHQRHSLCR